MWAMGADGAAAGLTATAEQEAAVGAVAAGLPARGAAIAARLPWVPKCSRTWLSKVDADRTI